MRRNKRNVLERMSELLSDISLAKDELNEMKERYAEVRASFNNDMDEDEHNRLMDICAMIKKDISEQQYKINCLVAQYKQCVCIL